MLGAIIKRLWLILCPQSSVDAPPQVVYGLNASSLGQRQLGSTNVWVYEGVTGITHTAVMIDLRPNTTYCEARIAIGLIVRLETRLEDYFLQTIKWAECRAGATSSISAPYPLLIISR
jgi:hypothetical protein